MTDSLKDDILDIIFTRMKASKGFPSLAKTVSSVLDNLQYDSLDIPKVVDYISSDFSLTQKVLKLVNSPMYSSFQGEVVNISQAVAVLGVEAVSHLALSVKVMESLSSEEDGGTPTLEKTLLAAEIAKEISSKVKSEDAAIVTMLGNTGALMVTTYLKNEMAVIEKLISEGMPLDVATRSALSISFSELGIAIARRWRFPQKLISDMEGTGDPEIRNIAEFSNTVSGLIIEHKQDALDNYVLKASTDFGFNISLVGNVIQAKVLTQAAHDESKPMPLSVSKTLTDDLEQLLKEFKDSKDSFEKYSKDLMFGLSNILGTERMFIFMRTTTGDFKIRAGVGKGVEDFKSKFKISAIFAPTVFHAVISKSADLMISNAAKVKKSALPEGYDIDSYNIKAFLLLPVPVGGAVTMMLYMDWKSERLLSETEMSVLREIRNLLIKYLPK